MTDQAANPAANLASTATQSNNQSDDPSIDAVLPDPEVASQSATTKQESSYTPVDIMVYGKVYTVNCPVGEEAQLKQAGKHINKFVQEVRRQAPQLSQEELLLLCSLDMYETLESSRTKEDENKAKEKQALSLVDKILSDAKSML